jgi:hypothetical protein
LVVGDGIVKVLSMKEPPSCTIARVLGDLCAVPSAEGLHEELRTHIAAIRR